MARLAVAATGGGEANQRSRMIAARVGMRERCRSRGAVSVRAAESQIDRHLVVEFSGVVFSTVSVGVTVSRRGARHYGVVAVAVVVLVIVAFAAVIVVALVVAVVVVVVPWSFSLCSRRRDRCRCRCPPPPLRIHRESSFDAVLSSEGTGRSCNCSVWWYRTVVARPRRCWPCSSRGPAIQLLAPQKALVVPYVRQREREIEREIEIYRERESEGEREQERDRARA